MVPISKARGGSAAVVVQRWKHNGYPNGRETWQELDELPEQLLALKGKLRDTQHSSPGNHRMFFRNWITFGRNARYVLSETSSRKQT